MIRFDKKWFNPLYFILNDLIKDTTVRTVLVYGGKSSAKTISITQILSKELIVKQNSSIAFRKESAIIPTTLKKSFNLSIDSMRLYPAVEKQDRRYLNKLGPGEIVMKGLDDSEKAKGIESYKYVYLDELNHFEQTEFEQFSLSLRGIEGQKIFGSWNPVDENSWVKTELVDKYEFTETDKFGTLPCSNSFIKISSCGKVVLIKTTYEDNYWIVGSPDGSYGFRDENLISEYESLAFKNSNSYKVNVLGEWGKTVFGGEFLKCWKSEIHTGDFEYDPDQAVYLYFDENVNPYFPCGFFQVGRDQKSPRLIHAIAAENPNNKINWMCREITRKLTEWKHKERLYIGGDATSQKEDVKLEKGDDMFRLIMAGLAEFKPQRKTPKANPSVRMSADFFNSILEGAVPGMTFGANRKCRKAVLDYENTKEDKNGKIDKKTVTNPITGIPYQPYGHFVDLTRYFLVNTFGEEYERYQRGGKETIPVIGKNYSKNIY
jgi:PBSX family phage terminase large subunit